MNGGRLNPLCATAENKPRDVPENYRMVGALFTFGKFRFLDLADLDWAMEMELACPVNKLGEVTLYQTGRHGASDGAGAPGFLYAIKPQVVIVNNGPRKALAGRRQVSRRPPRCTTSGLRSRRASKGSGRGTSRCSTRNTTPAKR